MNGCKNNGCKIYFSYHHKYSHNLWFCRKLKFDLIKEDGKFAGKDVRMCGWVMGDG